jgi:hypothetical protein
VPGEYASSIDVIYRDSSRVYCVVWYWEGPGQCYTELQCFTPAGSRVSRTRLEGDPIYRDGDRCHLGSGYIAAVHGTSLEYLVKGTGSVVGSYHAYGPGTTIPINLAWDGTYYVVSSSATRGEFRRYTPYGGYAGAWSSREWPPGLVMVFGTTFAHQAKWTRGRFLIATTYDRGDPNCIINMSTGRVVATWRNPAMSYRSACYGDSSKPGTYGGALWLGGEREDESLWVYEVDVEARGGAPVLPTSVGKIKAVYR